MITLGWPPASLGSNSRAHPMRRHRDAQRVRLHAKLLSLPLRSCAIPDGDIHLTVEFRPPSNRGDRANFPHLAKHVLDGVADALGVNDRRFVPTWVYGEPVRGGAVIITLGANQ